MTIKVVTYFSDRPNSPNEKWSGCCILPSGQRLEIWFCAGSEQAVIERAQAFYAREKARQDRLYASTKAAADNDEVEEVVRTSGKGAQFVGKVWMLNRATGERARVLPGEVASYAAQGYVRGGPRSK